MCTETSEHSYFVVMSVGIMRPITFQGLLAGKPVTDVSDQV